MARGSASRRRHSSATAARLSSSMAKSGRTSRARSSKSLMAGVMAPPAWKACGSGGTGTSRSPRMCSGSRLVARIFRCGQAPSSFVTSALASSTCSKLSRTRSARRARRKPSSSFSGSPPVGGEGDLEGGDDGGHHVARVAHAGEGHVEGAVVERGAEGVGQMDRQARLAGAPGAGERDQAGVRASQQLSDELHLGSPADELPALDRCEAARWSLERGLWGRIGRSGLCPSR